MSSKNRRDEANNFSLMDDLQVGAGVGDSAQGGGKATEPPPAEPPQSYSYEELHRKSRDVMPMCFEGAKLVVSKPLSNHFQISHTLTLSQALTGYRFGATYVGSNPTSTGEAFPILLGDVDLQGNSSATLIHQFANSIRLKFQNQIQQNQIVGSTLQLERRGRLSTLGLTVANPNLVNNSGVLVAHYLRRITERLDVGAEYVYQRDPKIPGNQISALSYAARYTTPVWTAAASLAAGALHFTYHHKQAENLQFAVDFESNFRAQESVTTFAYQIEIPNDIVLRASCDTNWTVGAVMEKKLSRQMPFSFVLSGMYNQSKMFSKFGVGLSIG